MEKVTTRLVRTRAGKLVTIDASDFDPELHQELEGDASQPRTHMPKDYFGIRDYRPAHETQPLRPLNGGPEAAAVKELGPPRSKEVKDELDATRTPLPRKRLVEPDEGRSEGISTAVRRRQAKLTEPLGTYEPPAS